MVSTKINLHPLIRPVSGGFGMAFLSKAFVSKNVVSEIAAVTQNSMRCPLRILPVALYR
jgi:hypothetical protein